MPPAGSLQCGGAAVGIDGAADDDAADGSVDDDSADDDADGSGDDDTADDTADVADDRGGSAADEPGGAAAGADTAVALLGAGAAVELQPATVMSATAISAIIDLYVNLDIVLR